MKKLIIFVICLVLVSSVFVISNFNDEEEGDEMGEEGIIDDTTPIGKDLDGYWIYQTRDNKIVRILDYPTTPEGIKYAELIEVMK